MRSNLLLVALAFFTYTIFNCNIYSQEQLIILDEEYSDWYQITGVSDTSETVSGIDLKQLKVANFEEYIFLYIEMSEMINLQDNNSITLFIDSDNNPATGFSINGIGAELKYEFGKRGGRYYYNNTSTSIGHENIELITMPTVTSNIFEIQININSIIAGRPLFADSTISVIVKNNVTDGDIIPNDNGGYKYSFINSEPQSSVSYSIKKLDENDLRVVSYNIERDQLFDAANKEAHRRIFQALKPDIIGFQEIYNHSAQQTADLIEEFLPSSEGEEWYNAKKGSDVITVSRFPITQSFAIDNNAAFLIDMQSKYQRDLLFINAHTPCCANNESRQKEIDNFMSFVREAKEDGGVLTITEGTPIVVVGDMNLVGYKQQQTTLITGDIVNQSIYGEAFLPDWDSTHFADTKPVVTNMPSTFTWYNEGSSFSPGRLDYIVFSNSVMSKTNGFNLFTNTLPEDSLRMYNLNSSDVTSVADHIPVVVDFRFSPFVSVNNHFLKLNYEFELNQNYPNPFNPSTTIKYSIPVETRRGVSPHVTLKVYDILGREVAILVNQNQNGGNYEVQFSTNGVASRLPSGVYFYKLTATTPNSSATFTATKKLLLLK
ncbi:MAG: endonuclease/exonuclease/phosphatase family protein [Melioribacteraceae bacterium]|nr:endonuclease/exonuclease/phosphatase family protein [Melioribacteraceae bacterium]